MYALFDIDTVMRVTGSERMAKDRKQRDDRREQSKPVTFAHALEKAMEEKVAPPQYRTTVYGKNAMLSSIQYQTREYHY